MAVNTYGVDLGDGMFGEDNVRTHFTIGDEIIATADDTTKILTIRVNGEVVKSMPTSMGKDSTPTASGFYIVGAPVQAHHHGLVHLRGTGQLAQRISHRCRLGHPNVLQRRLRALRAMVGRRPGAHQHQPRVPQCEPRATPSGSTTTSSAATSSRSSTPLGRRCRAPRGSVIGTSPGRSGRPVTPTPDQSPVGLRCAARDPGPRAGCGPGRFLRPWTTACFRW